MTDKELKRIMRLLKSALQELEREAISEGISLASRDFKKLQDKLREKILEQEGYSLGEYVEAKDALEGEQEQEKKSRKSDLQEVIDKVAGFKGDEGKPGRDAHTPTQEELIALIKPLIPAIPKDGHTPTKEEILILIKPLIPKVEFPSDKKLLSLIEPLIPDLDLTPINDAIIEVKQRVDSIKIPEPINPDKIKSELKEFFHDNFSKNFEKNIDILGMPDFRKLAMGLREDIDRIDSSGGGHTVQNEGVDLSQRTNLNFIGAGVTATDNAGTDATDITISTDLTNLNRASFGIVLDGSGAPIQTGAYASLVIPFAGTITGWQIFETSNTPISTSTVIDVWKDTYANQPPTVLDTIAGTEKPTLTAATKNQDLTLTTWTTAVAANDIIRFNVDSNDLAQKITVVILITKT